jgi:polysaccharide deacetylase 2 family uncharacterized protein YibQ
MRGRGFRWVLSLLACCAPAIAADDSCSSQPPAGLAAPEPRSTVVLIIDDLGYQWRNGMAMVELPGKLNLAVLPHTPHGARLAEAGFAAGKEILLHAPMSNRAGEPVERGALTATMSRAAFDATLTEALAAVPHVRGVNNHMGSELTEYPLQMGWVMQTLLRRDLYFVDSRTSAETVAASTAADFSVPHLSRSVFLDNERSRPAIDHFFRRLLARAEEDGIAVGIGHPYPETADYLREAIPRLRCRGVRLALVSEVVSQSLPAAVPREENAYSPASEPYLDAAFSHVGLGLGYGEFPEVENTGGEHRVGTTEEDAFHQVIEVSNTP